MIELIFAKADEIERIVKTADEIYDKFDLFR